MFDIVPHQSSLINGTNGVRRDAHDEWESPQAEPSSDEFCFVRERSELDVSFVRGHSIRCFVQDIKTLGIGKSSQSGCS
jgi:hypothetical protein